LLAHNDPRVQSAALAELLSIWLAGFHIPNDPEATEQLRAELLAEHCALVRELTAVRASNDSCRDLGPGGQARGRE
jgi:hypothetical protein